MDEVIKIDLPEEPEKSAKEIEAGFRYLNSPKLDVQNWMLDVDSLHMSTDLVEVQFKNTRKGYFTNSNKLQLKQGDIVAVESSPGHDIGRITLTGELVKMQIRKNNIDPARYEFKRIYRIAKANDLEKWEKAKSKEHHTMLRSRKIAEDLQLNMKIGDVEYQGDGNKAIFYYIADERVDFRQLIKYLAGEFRVRIEMRQIGARQEAGRIGGIGSCGRELCCSSWMSKFVSVNTVAARWQELSLNPQKLAGNCGKLKCCLNYELDAYVEVQNTLPRKDIPLETQEGTYYLLKTDVFKKEMTYSTSSDFASNLATISSDRASEIIQMNRKGKKPVKLMRDTGMPAVAKIDFENVVGQDDVTRFDSKGRRKGGKRRSNRNGNANQRNNRKVKKVEARSGDQPNAPKGGPSNKQGDGHAGNKPRPKRNSSGQSRNTNKRRPKRRNNNSSNQNQGDQ